MSALIGHFQRVFDLKGWGPGLRFVKCKKNKIGARHSFWELNGDDLLCFDETKRIHMHSYPCICMRK